MKFYRKYLFGISLSFLCCTIAAIKLYSNLYLPRTNTAHTNDSYYFKYINRTTKELIFPSGINSQIQALDIITTIIKKYDNNTVIISGSNTENYLDYYFYSPKLKIAPLLQGSNIHVAITGAPVHIYIGTPYIDYDF